MAQQGGAVGGDVLFRTNSLVARPVYAAGQEAGLARTGAPAVHYGHLLPNRQGGGHSAKGLEFDRVYIAMWGELEAAGDRANMGVLAYVACTRAKHALGVRKRKRAACF